MNSQLVLYTSGPVVGNRFGVLLVSSHEPINKVLRDSRFGAAGTGTFAPSAPGVVDSDRRQALL